MKNYTLELIAFLSGAAVMVLELTGSRVLAPYVGVSLYVWTSLIGIILGSLSMGYYLGGKAADRSPSRNALSFILLFAALAVGLTAWIKEPLLTLVRDAMDDIRIASATSTIILFAVPSVLLGMVTPYLVRLKMLSVQTSGETAGNLYALSTMGSIAGTFAAGFFLIPALGNTMILYSVAGTLAFLSLLALAGGTRAPQLLLLLILAAGVLSARLDQIENLRAGIVDQDTRYNRALIVPGTDAATLRPVLRLYTDGDGVQSAMFLDDPDELVFGYTKFYRLAGHFVPELKRALAIGGGAYSYPRDYLKRFPETAMDVVELDPALTALAREYFHLTDDPRLRIFHEDGRSFLNRTSERYDVIFMDAFKSYSPPFELTTQEAVRTIYERLNERGAVLVNIISAIEGPKGRFLRAEYLTYTSVFPQVHLFPVSVPDDGNAAQNILLVALKTDETPPMENPDEELNGYLTQRWRKTIPEDVPLLTDDHAPVEYYLANLLQ